MDEQRRPGATFEPDWLQRSLDRHYLWGLAFMLVLLVSFPLYRVREPHLRADAKKAQQVTYTRLGASLFDHNCAECHGHGGNGGDGPTLNAKQFLTSTSDEQMHLLISGGVSGTSMPAWSIDFGGSLTDQQIDEIVTYLRSLEPHAPSVPDWREGKATDAHQ